MTAIPDPEIEILINTSLAAVRMAESGELVEGHAELVYGMRRAEVMRDEGNEWGSLNPTLHECFVRSEVIATWLQRSSPSDGQLDSRHPGNA